MKYNEDLLPPRFFAEVQITVGSQGAFWAPAKPTRTVPLQFTHPDLFEVQVFNDEEGPRLVSAIELVSPSNKDRPANRHQFVVKCASYLQQGIHVVVVDVVTIRTGSLHGELLDILQPAQSRSAGRFSPRRWRHLFPPGFRP